MKLRIEDDAGEVLYENLLDSREVLCSTICDEHRGQMLALLVDALMFARPRRRDDEEFTCIAFVDARDVKTKPILTVVKNAQD